MKTSKEKLKKVMRDAQKKEKDGKSKRTALKEAWAKYKK